MNKVLKWLAILLAALVVIVIAAVMLIPQFVDVQKYKPRIEQAVSEQTGREFSLGGDIDLSLFPWVGVTLSDLHLGNPKGFSQKDMVFVKRFEVRVKVMPLLSKQVEVKTFLLEEPVIYLEKPKTGKANWEDMAGQKKSTQPADQKAAPAKEPGGKSQGLPIESLVVGNFAITKGKVTYVDRSQNVTHEIKDLELALSDVNLDSPVKILFKALVDEKPVSLDGKIGPIGKEPGKGQLNVDISLKALDIISLAVNGSVNDPAVNPEFDLALTLDAFSPRKMMAALGQPFPVKTTDPNALDKVSLAAQIKGSPSAVSVNGGKLVLDDSNMDFDMTAKAFSKPDIAFKLSLDQMDLDRYMPPPSEKKPGVKPSEKKPGPPSKPDYEPLRKLVLNGQINAGQVTAKGLAAKDILLKITAKNGMIHMDPFSLKVAEGTLSKTAILDVRKKDPKAHVTLKLDGVQAAPFVQALAKKDIIEGTMASDLKLGFTGDTPAMIKKTLKGGGQLVFNDGAVVGVDLTNLMSNVKSKLTGQQAGDKRPRTDFAEFRVPFNIKDAIVSTKDTALVSPLLRVAAKGTAHLTQNTLDFRITPRVVGTLKGQGDTKDRTGLMVPVLVTGTFAEPKFKPDMKAMMTQELPDAQQLKQVLGDKDTQKQAIESVKKDANSLLQGLIPSQ